MLDRTFLLTLAFLMMLGSTVAFTVDVLSTGSDAEREAAVYQLPRVVITGSAPSAESIGAIRSA